MYQIILTILLWNISVTQKLEQGYSEFITDQEICYKTTVKRKIKIKKSI